MSFRTRNKYSCWRLHLVLYRLSEKINFCVGFEVSGSSCLSELFSPQCFSDVWIAFLSCRGWDTLPEYLWVNQPTPSKSQWGLSGAIYRKWTRDPASLKVPFLVENHRENEICSVSSDFSVGIGLADEVVGIPPFIGMFYFEIGFVGWGGYVIILNKCLLNMQRILVGTGNTNRCRAMSSVSKNRSSLCLERQGMFKREISVRDKSSSEKNISISRNTKSLTVWERNLDSLAIGRGKMKALPFSLYTFFCGSIYYQGGERMSIGTCIIEIQTWTTL